MEEMLFSPCKTVERKLAVYKKNQKVLVVHLYQEDAGPRRTLLLHTAEMNPITLMQ